jgi:RNA polymerase sigma factor (sigma-70 family)
LVAVPSIGRASEVTPRRAAPEADATRDLYERYARQIYSYCLHQLGNREEAEDATQSTFLNAFRGLKRGVDPEFESAWLYKIAQNVCLTRQRSSSRRRRVESPGDLDAMQDYVPAHQADSDELIRLPEALDAMPEQQRRALLLREWQGLSYKEIGEELDLSQAAVETLLFRARRSLAAGLSEQPVKKAGIANRLGGAGDVGSIISILKSLLLTGGVKVATAVATVAATSVVAATPATRHAVEDVVAPRHVNAPVHQVSANAAPSGGVAASVSAPLSLVPTRPAAASAQRNAPLTVAASKAGQHRLALLAHSAVMAGLMVPHVPSVIDPWAAISAPSVPTLTVEVPVAAPLGEPTVPVATPAAPQPATPQPSATQPSATQPSATQPAATAPKDDANAGQGTNSGNNNGSGGTTQAAQPAAAGTPAAQSDGNSGANQGATKTGDGSGASKADDNRNGDNSNRHDNKKGSNVVVAPKSSTASGSTTTTTTTTTTSTTTTTAAATVAPPKTTTTSTTTTPTTTTTSTTTTSTTTTAAAPPPPPPAPTATVTAPHQSQGEKNNRPDQGHRGDSNGENNDNKDGNGKRK